MTQEKRVKLSAMQRTDLWGRWKAGQSLHEIGRVFGKDHVSIQFMLAQHGGIAPAARPIHAKMQNERTKQIAPTTNERNNYTSSYAALCALPAGYRSE
jgi:hypothetical protein